MKISFCALLALFTPLASCVSYESYPSQKTATAPVDTSRDWLFRSSQDVLLFNPNLLDNTPCATLLEWTGPNTSASPLGITGVLTPSGYAWRTWNAGTRTFYVAKTNDSCDSSMSNAVVMNGAYVGYQIGVNEISKMASDSRKWIWCDWSGCQSGSWPCGCDGKAYFSGVDWTPQGNQ